MDRAMCTNMQCPSFKLCLRAQAKPSPLQTFADFAVKRGEKRCEAFIPIRGNK
jgi:hypothetical protein